ncbi:MAG: hypothetical protein H0U26_09145, partial [Acidimicrobiia bacterium]|nr:hypothetical protein [Acidimicrobiia bacterium]
AAWFGGSLMGAVGLNGAAAQADQPGQRAKVANAGWARWTPVNLAAIGAHLVGGALLVTANKGRVQGQQGVASATALKTALTVAALGATAYSRKLGQTAMDAGDPPVAGATEPASSTPPQVAEAQNRLKILQWAIPALTAGVVVLSARMGEQQRPAEVARGVLARLNPAA